MDRRRLLTLPLLASACSSTEDVIGRRRAMAASGSGHVLEVANEGFTLDGEPFEMMGIRVGSATRDQLLTDSLIAQLSEYQWYGVNTIAVYVQGTSGAQYDPFSTDGTQLDEGHASRLEQLLRAADERGMAAVVGIFYAMDDASQIHLRDWTSSLEAVRTITRALLPHRNVIINLANVLTPDSHSGRPWERLGTITGAAEALAAVRSEDASRLVGAGGSDTAYSIALKSSVGVDAVLFLGGEVEESFQAFVAEGIRPPFACVELYGSWTEQFEPPGVFPDSAKERYFADVDAAVARAGLSVFFHSNLWTQGPKSGPYPIRFDLGGQGTADDPGIRWYFEFVKKALGL